ncbi:MAG: hypothetical protein HYY00_03710 [Chloroflexi bacterium]|nr:hypothetical protein [Chloroflexota bacterium]
MTRLYRQAVRCLAVLAALLLALAPLGLAHGQTEPVKIRVEVNDRGFQGTPGDFTIEVEQGQLVELTFVWAHQGYIHDEHIMVLSGYNLEWEKISSEQREATLQFIADKAGTFDFKCDLDCEVHDYLQKGHLKVGKGGGGAAAFTPTTLTVTPSSWATAGDPITLTTVLTDDKGAPVAKADVRFFLRTDFAGTEDAMEIGIVKTDTNGVAFLDFRPVLSAQQQTIIARFDGKGIYGESGQSIEVQQIGVPAPAYSMEPVGLGPASKWAPAVQVQEAAAPGLDPVRYWAQVALAMIILSVWATFGFVLYQALGVARVRARR